MANQTLMEEKVFKLEWTLQDALEELDNYTLVTIKSVGNRFSDLPVNRFSDDAFWLLMWASSSNPLGCKVLDFDDENPIDGFPAITFWIN